MFQKMNLVDKKQQEIIAISCCHQGASHIRTGKVCQDAVYARFRKGDRYAVAIVSDGHGSSNYFRSDRGATFAVEAAKEAICRFMTNCKDTLSGTHFVGQLCHNPEKFLQQLEQNIVYRWREKVRMDYYAESFTSDEEAQMTDDARKKFYADPDSYFVKAYGATLIAVVVCPGKFWMGLHVGDGKCVAQRGDGSFYQPIPWDERCFLNVTTSLCDAHPLGNFRHCFHTGDFPTAIFVGSDGIDDSFANDEALYGFYKEVIKTFREKDSKEAFKELDEFLPELSKRGSEDDVSVGGIVFMD